MRLITLLITLVFFSSSLWAQKDEKEKENELSNSTQFLIENLVEDSDGENFDFGTQFEYLEEYRKNPLDLNNATEQELTAFGMFSAIQIQALLLYRKRFGQIFSLYELQGVPTFDVKTIVRLTPYIAVAATKEQEKMNFGKMFKFGRHQIFARYQRILEQQKGYKPGTGTRYLGSPDKFYLRYRMTYKDRMSLGLTMEKDAGEEFFTGSNPQGFDYYSGHFYLKKISKHVHSIALGDFQVYFGQGLTVWGGFGIRKGAQVLNIKRISLPIRPYTSVNEALFMRGAAGHFRFLKENNLEVTVFGSFRQRDANIQSELDSLTDDLDIEVSSLQDIGYHRTISEIEDENSIGFLTSGARVRYTGKSWHVAGNFVYNYLTNELKKEKPALYQQYDFIGKQSLNASIDYSVRYRNIQFFGETAVNEKGGIATLNSLLAELDPRVSIAVLHRYYDKKYYTLNGNAFGETSDASNESGLYIGLESRLGAGVKMSTYFDLFRFPWLRYQVDAPTQGYEVFGKLEYSPNYFVNTYAQYRFERKGKNLSNNLTHIDQIINHDKHNLRFHFGYKASSQLALSSRIEFSFYQNQEFNQGFMIYQDVVIKPKIIPLKMQLRLAFFDTDNYDTRIYAYENDVLYAFSVLPYYGQGLRYYFNINYRINQYLTAWFRFSQTYFVDREVISSGLGEIEGRTRSEIKIQLRAKF
ncbi:ComEA family DNA-binding protein [Aureispira anguillae]|uniref:Helix-hairpin-helix domain-containing protein n=1 Tax=Aureispira anguillae TaxID=2864201 RepID=A0A915YBV9_9BACT|nr:helix-hairpin-helix domain-containing protein [Aureispira anguillae]BDS10230.1 helix-hairpin-helix domain-containing protein [Aureispira anguillae]